MAGKNVDLEVLLDQIPVALTYVDRDGVILYRNRTAADRPAPGPREKGADIRGCHAHPESLKMIRKIFNDFSQGRKTAHHYVSKRMGIEELVTLVPIFQEDRFAGCLSVIHPLEIKGERRSFPAVKG
jgi:DUF438 domain-containing protein